MGAARAPVRARDGRATARLAGLIAAAALAAACGAAPAGAASTPSASGVSAHEGAVEATLTWSGSGEGLEPASGLSLAITRGGQQAYLAPVTSQACLTECGIERGDGGPLLVSDLEGNGQPNVIVELYTGGAHCCSVLQIFTYDTGVMAYRPIERNFGDPGARVADVAGDGHLELESADDRFAYEFAPYAYSGLPLQVWSLREGRLVDTTSSFPKALAADAARCFTGFVRARSQGYGNGLIAAWAADEYRLGRRALVSRTLAREAARGNLRSREHYGPAGAAFVAKLKRFLKSNGYG